MFGKNIAFYSQLQSLTTPLLLDTYGSAAVAYSVRKVSSGYTGSCLRVRRSNDNAEQDIGFSGNDLDTASLLSFVGSNSGYVAQWYDQSGNARHATQSTATQQPRIVNAGTLEQVNGKTSILFDGTDDRLKITAFTYSTNNYNSFVGKRTSSGGRLYGIAADTGTPPAYLWALWQDNKYYLQASTTGYQVGPTGTTDTSTAQLLLTGLASGLTMSMYKNASVIASAKVALTLATNIGWIGSYGGGGQVAGCALQEIIYYNIDRSSDRSGIETNINAYYGIY